MSEIYDGGPAFPGKVCVGHTAVDETPIYEHPQGATMRDYFAAHAPEPPASWRGGERNTSALIDWLWRYADLMLKAREA